MKKKILYFLIFCFKSTYAQNNDEFVVQYEDRFEVIEGNYFGKLSFDTLRNNDGSYEIGNLAISKKGDTSNIKVGLWKEFDKNNDLKAFGEYKIGTYISCCFSGPCRSFYNYKFGKWIYYHTKGQLKAIGTYSIIISSIETSCQGGDKGKAHTINDEWQYWDEKSKPIKIYKELKEELEKIDF